MSYLYLTHLSQLRQENEHFRHHQQMYFGQYLRLLWGYSSESLERLFYLIATNSNHCCRCAYVLDCTYMAAGEREEVKKKSWGLRANDGGENFSASVGDTNGTLKMRKGSETTLPLTHSLWRKQRIQP